jgi:hypothetical protein
MHPNEPNLEALKKIQKELMVAESTNENVKRLKALEIQIERHKKAEREVKEANTVNTVNTVKKAEKKA